MGFGKITSTDYANEMSNALIREPVSFKTNVLPIGGKNINAKKFLTVCYNLNTFHGCSSKKFLAILVFNLIDSTALPSI